MDKRISHLISDNYRQIYKIYSDGKDENEKLYLNVTFNVFHIYDENRRCKMPERYKPDEAAHSVTVVKTTFVVNSFTDTQTADTAEKLIIRMLKPNYFSDHFKWMLKKHNLRKIRLHDLRHTCA